MEAFDWDVEKDQWLIRERGISFERIVHLIARGNLLDVVAHHNASRHPGQRILIVQVDAYAYLVPFVEQDDRYVLKTIIPSRKATRDYLGGPS